MKNNAHTRLLQLQQTILAAFLAIAVALVFWGVARAATILRREDNPRLVETELRIQRGRILDRNGVVLAETVGPPDELQRLYPLPYSGPAIGYYSFRHGTAGVEERFNTLLRQGEVGVVADWTRQLLHRPLSGWDIRLTLDATWQKTADSLLPPQPAALLLLELAPTAVYADILALVSHPSYDPNQLDDQFETLTQAESAPLLNRVTQGLYQPGMSLQPLILAGVMEQRLLHLADTIENPNQPVAVNGNSLTCLTPPPEPTTWETVLHHTCPAAMQQLADQLGVAGLDQIFAAFQLTQSPILPLDTETAELLPTADPLLAGIGQDTLLVTPLQLGLAWAALAGNGQLPHPRLVTAVQDSQGQWQELSMEGKPQVAVSAGTAATLRQSLSPYQNLLEHTALALSGPEGSTNSWYLGMAPASQPRFVVVVVVEKGEGITAVQTIGRTLLQTVVATHTP